jgi:high-affinity iron transporter
MLAAFLICLREGIEIFLVVIPLLVYFNKNKLYSMTKSVILGGAVGAFLSAIIATVIFSQTALLNGPASELFDGLLGIVIAVLVLYSVVLLRKSKTFSTNPDEKFISLSRKGVSIITGITFFRELLEATLFILTSSGTSPIIVAGMSILGLAAAALIVYVVSKGISNFNIGVVFYILNLFLIALGAYYLGDGLEVLFGSYIPEIYTIGILVYAIPSYIIIAKKDLKKLMNRIK